jgi:branched-chain amino acid transport system permease protein
VAAAEPLGSAADTRSPGEQRELEAWREAQRGEPPYRPEAKPARSWVASSIIDAAVAGAITAALGLFFLGLTTDVGPGPLSVRQRWGALVIAVAIVFGVRLLLNLLVYKKPQSAVAPRPPAPVSLAPQRHGQASGRRLLRFGAVPAVLLIQFFPARAGSISTSPS